MLLKWRTEAEIPSNVNSLNHQCLFFTTNKKYCGMGESLRLCLVPIKFEGKCKGKKIQRKSRRTEKVKENKKID